MTRTEARGVMVAQPSQEGGAGIAKFSRVLRHGLRPVWGRNAPSPTASILCVPNPRVRLLGYPAAERIGIDLPKFVAEGVEHLPLGIERTNPAGQLFAMFDVH